MALSIGCKVHAASAAANIPEIVYVRFGLGLVLDNPSQFLICVNLLSKVLCACLFPTIVAASYGVQLGSWWLSARCTWRCPGGQWAGILRERRMAGGYRGAASIQLSFQPIFSIALASIYVHSGVKWNALMSIHRVRTWELVLAEGHTEVTVD